MRVPILLSAVVAVGLSSTAQAEILFRGHAVVTAVTPQCTDFDVGNQNQSRYHPPTVGGNDDFTGITFLSSHSGHGYTIDGALTAGFKNAEAGGLGWSNYDWTGSQAKQIARTPATITAATRFVFLKAQLRAPRDDDGGALCIITFEAAYTREPE